MWKTVLAGATALAIAGGSLVYAQQPHDDDFAGPRWRPNAEDVGAFTDARIAALKAGLKLTADQEKNWPAFEKALRDAAKVRQDRFAARASADAPRDPIERLRTHADALTQGGNALKQIADTAAPLYASLDDGQKRRFVVLARLGGGERFGRWHHHHMRGHGGPGGPGGPDSADDEPPQQ